MSEEYAAAGANRSPSPRRDDRERARSRSRSPVRMDTERRDDRRDREDARARAQEEENRGNNLHVSGLSLRVEERDLEAAFSKYGRIAHCQVMRDPHTKESRGFAFVKFELADEAEAAIAGLSGTQILDRTINVDKARRGRARTPTPGAYHGPPKREAFGGRMDRPYDPRGGYPPRGYERGYERGYDDRYGGSRGYDDRDRGDRYGGRGYDDRDRGGYAIPMRGDDRRGGGYDDRRYDDRERGYSSRSSGYDDRRRY